MSESDSVDQSHGARSFDLNALGSFLSAFFTTLTDARWPVRLDKGLEEDINALLTDVNAFLGVAVEGLRRRSMGDNDLVKRFPQ